MIGRYRKKPIVIEAVQFTKENTFTALAFVTCDRWINHDAAGEVESLTIRTLEGEMRCDLGNYIICGVNGEFYPCKPDIFAATYDPELDWQKAEKHFSAVRKQYEDLQNTPGVNVAIALSYVFVPITLRYEGGERSQELYDEMLSVE